eukprot:97302-Prymnesium_polylepis.1
MPIPQELLKNIVKKTKTSPDGIQAIRLKSAINKDKKFHVRYNLNTAQIRVFRNTKPVKEVELDIWAKFTAEGTQRMKASAYREWCETNGRDIREPVKFNTKKGPILRVADVYR